MPNIKSASKRDELSKAAQAANKAKKTALKTSIKKFDAAVAAGNKEEAAVAYKVAVKAIDKAAGTGLIHKNNAAHKKSRLTLSMNEL
jgi:small subunit ribosomal protein S20